MLTLLLCAGFFITGFAWGFAFLYATRYLPLLNQHNQLKKITLEHLDKQIQMFRKMLGIPEVREDGSMVSPIQIEPQE